MFCFGCFLSLFVFLSFCVCVCVDGSLCFCLSCLLFVCLVVLVCGVFVVCVCVCWGGGREGWESPMGGWEMILNIGLMGLCWESPMVVGKMIKLWAVCGCVSNMFFGLAVKQAPFCSQEPGNHTGWDP